MSSLSLSQFVIKHVIFFHYRLFLHAGAKFLDRIKKAYDRNAGLASLLVDPEFAAEINGAFSTRTFSLGLFILFVVDERRHNVVDACHYPLAFAARQPSLRRLVSLCAAGGIACPSLSASLGYLDQYRRARLPANLTQAQRDFFGAHTYERTDQAGAFHTEWAKLAAAGSQ